jgi:hypothetical protein
MWGHWIKKADPESHVPSISYANVVPGALFYLNLPRLLLAKRENDAVELARSHIGVALWGIIALVTLIGTAIAIFIASRRIAATVSLPPTP